MKTVTLPKNVINLLDVISGKNYEEKIKHLTMEFVQNKLKECKEEIFKFEIKYGMEFKDFENKWNNNEIKNRHSHEIEKDYIEWEAIEMEKTQWLYKLIEMRCE